MRGYKEFFGITGSPFGKGISIAALHRYAQFDELASYLTWVAEEGSTGLVTGEVGAGKSTAIRAFLDTLDERQFHVCYVGNTDETRSVFRQMAWGFGMRAKHLKGDLRDDVHARVMALWKEHGKRTVLVVDEAQGLGTRGLGELRLLTNFVCDSESPLALILVGQVQLRQKLKNLDNVALEDRIFLRYHLAGLSLAETRSYIQAHLKAVGANPDLFTKDAVNVIFQHSKGLPRRINKISILSLLKAGHKKVNPIDGPLVEAALKDLMQE